MKYIYGMEDFMERTKLFPMDMELTEEFESKNYEHIIKQADNAQKELIHYWQAKEKDTLEQLVLISRNILNFWTDMILKNRLWTALIRCGAWIGTVETIERFTYEERLDQWALHRTPKNILSVRHIKEILQLLEVKGVMAHEELVKELHLNHSSTLTEIMKKVTDFGIIDIRKAGKYKLYSLTDTGIRYARQIRSGENRQTLLKTVLREYDLQMDEEALDAYLQSADYTTPIKQGQKLAVKMDNHKLQACTVESILKQYEDYEQEMDILSLKTTRAAEKDTFDNLTMKMEA